MLDPLYLDTARLGQMSPGAYRASVDFARLASEHGCSMYFSKFLSDGANAWPESFNHKYPGLSNWDGISGLFSRLKQLAGASPASDVIVAARSAELMRFATRLMIGPCRNVLLTDLTWPNYEQIFLRERRGSECQQTRLPLRDLIFGRRISADELIEYITCTFLQNRCDGLFLPLVDNLGVRLPVQEIVRRLRSEAEVRFVLVDGAQAIGHVPLQLDDGYCDLLLAGCHKWLRGFSPLGLAFFGNLGSQEYVRSSLVRWLTSGELDDPVLRFVCELQNHRPNCYGETVQISPLFTANAAALDSLTQQAPEPVSRVSEDIVTVAESNGWRQLAPDSSMQSRIVLFKPKRGSGIWRHDQVREAFLRNGIALSSYETGCVRISLPNERLLESDLDLLGDAFSHCHGL